MVGLNPRILNIKQAISHNHSDSEEAEKKEVVFTYCEDDLFPVLREGSLKKIIS